MGIRYCTCRAKVVNIVMTKVTIDGITYAKKSKKEAVLAVKPDASLKSGVYVTHIDPEAHKRYLEKARNSM